MAVQRDAVRANDMKIQVLGTGCAKCKQLTVNAEKAVAELGLGVAVEKVEDIREIMKFGVMTTPALAVDGKIRSAGKVLSPADVKNLLR
jgi:small redox-active disulfide protein 2